MASGKVFDEHLGVISALRENFTRQDDVETVRALVSVAAEIENTLHSQESDVVNSIKALTSQVEEARIKAVYPEEEGAHETRVQNLGASIAASKEHIAELTRQLKEIETDRHNTEERMREIAVHKATLDHMLMQAEPQIRHQLSLYAHVSKISWQFDAQNRVAGTVSDLEAADLRHFDMPEDGASRFDTTNRLWRLMTVPNSEGLAVPGPVSVDDD